MNASGETFSKEERLCSYKTVNSLFEEGNVFYTGLFRVVWQFSSAQQTFPVKVAFGVPKKIFKAAVTRNLVKRRMREAWRKNKFRLYEHLNKKNQNISLFFVFRDKTVPDYINTEKSVNDAINKLILII